MILSGLLGGTYRCVLSLLAPGSGSQQGAVPSTAPAWWLGVSRSWLSAAAQRWRQSGRRVLLLKSSDAWGTAAALAVRTQGVRARPRGLLARSRNFETRTRLWVCNGKKLLKGKRRAQSPHTSRSSTALVQHSSTDHSKHGRRGSRHRCAAGLHCSLLLCCTLLLRLSARD